MTLHLGHRAVRTIQRIAAACAGLAVFIGVPLLAWIGLGSSLTSAARVAESAEVEVHPLSAEMVALGDSLFNGLTPGSNCAVCHGDNGVGSKIAPSLTRLAGVNRDKAIEEISATIANGIYWPPELRAPMPAYRDVLTKRQIQALSGYVYQLSGRRASE